MPTPSADRSDPTSAELAPAEPTFAETAAAAPTTPKWDKVEQERLTRRAALRKMGYTSSIALFSMFAVDDLARMAIKKMEQHKETRQIAETMAKEFRNSGIALANPNSSDASSCCKANSDCTCCGGSAITGDCCSFSSNQNACCSKSYGVGSPNPNVSACQQCCYHAWAPQGFGPGTQYVNACIDACGGIV